ncbi:FAD-binding protein [Nocardioides sp. GY 10113]|uniref:D-arabinono-1,4-lactone oxidase n=1 Tax=Nocardioides sp. GY 10113 TaxID=2569761 RepID=UPI0010A9193B|nr:D-arabinono-1,4-lactone oxidase [Nocardioides sp. GY 10113]TIC81295.1 FAD-binding protein [Nocardioides sp. GY 10113]
MTGSGRSPGSTAPRRRNWAGNLEYRSATLAHPRDVAELAELVRRNRRVKALGSRHSFSDVADTDGVQVSLDRLPAHVVVDRSGAAPAVACAAGMTYDQLSDALRGQGLALPNLASLPHISVGGAIQTGTHGSGAGNPALSGTVSAVELVDATGRSVLVRDDSPDFGAVVVGLGAFGIVHRVTQRCVPAFEVAQRVWEDLPWDALLADLRAVTDSAYSVSLFTRFDSETVDQVWVKRRMADPPAPDLTEWGARAATSVRHMLPGTPPDNVTEQLDRPGPSSERLPHFRPEFRPGRGDELQSEYLVDVEHGVHAIAELRALGDEIAPLLHTAEIRRVAPDTAWLSPSGARDSLALHFTWQSRSREVAALLPRLEARLIALEARPHWGKIFTMGAADLGRAYPRLGDFAAAVERWDPERRFANPFLDRVLGAAG